LGLTASKELATNLYQQAVASLASIGDNTGDLLEIAKLIVERRH